MTSESLLPVGYLTDDVPAKAVIASASVVLTSLFDALCQYNAASADACALLGGVPVLLKLLLAMMGLDLISGVLAARAKGERITSKRLSIGMKRKTLMLLTAVASVVIDATLREHGLPFSGLLARWTMSWFIAVEALSLYENGDRMGVPMPPFLRTAIEWLLQRTRREAENALPEVIHAPPSTPSKDQS
jgi:toxin secretion/phage lysis holin